MNTITHEDKMRLAALLASRASTKTSDLQKAKARNSSPELQRQLQEDAEWCRRMAGELLSTQGSAHNRGGEHG